MNPIFQNPAYLAQILQTALPQELATLLQQGPPEIQQAVQTEMQRRQQGSLQPGDMVQPPPGGQMMPQTPAAGLSSAMAAGAQAQMPGQGWQPFQASPPRMSMTLPTTTPGEDLAPDALAARKPAAPAGLLGVRKSDTSAPQKGGASRGLMHLSDSDRLNWQQVAAHGGQVPPAIRSLLASGA